jgi:hypothetical protein
MSKQKDDDDWATDPDHVGCATEKEQRWTQAKTNVTLSELRKQVTDRNTGQITEAMKQVKQSYGVKQTGANFIK